MRGLSRRFLEDLNSGLLAPIRDRVKADHSLCLEIREEKVNVYYRGGNLLRLMRNRHGYLAFFDKKYAQGEGPLSSSSLPAGQLLSDHEVNAWLGAIPELKNAMDLYFGNHPKEEREAQQLIVRDNNFGKTSRATDYYICDIEYANQQGRFDFVAVRWPSSGATRKRQSGHRLVLAEVKFGDGAVSGKAGLHSHINDINAFLGTSTNLQSLKDEMVLVFNQKRALGLVNCGRALKGFSDEPPILLLVLVNHDPASSKLRETLASLPPSPHAEMYVASGCFMGYGLFDQGVFRLDDALARFETSI